MKRLFYVVNVDWFFISHRLPLALHAIRQGAEVFVVTADTRRRKELESYGIRFLEVNFKRSGSNPIHELRCVARLAALYREYRPDVIHHITLKAALLGSLAAKLTGQRRVVNAISGFGYNFTDNRAGLLQAVVMGLIKVAFKSRHFSFILQNPDDMKMVSRLQLVPEKHLHLIKGSGIDLKRFAYHDAVEKERLQILFPARILRDKGVAELIEAASLLKKDWQGKIEFILAGDCDKENLAVYPEEELRQQLIPQYITWVGFQKEMYALYVQSDLVALPSYREGLPKSLIEACAVGRPIVTTDVPGCRECVVPQHNGFLVPPKDGKALAEAIACLVRDKTLRKTFGENSRALAEKEFSIEHVIERTFDIYNNLSQSS